MKRLSAKGLGRTVKKADVLLWKKKNCYGQRGFWETTHLRYYLTSLFYMNGLYFTLGSGKEHRQLHHSPCQIQVIEKGR